MRQAVLLLSGFARCRFSEWVPSGFFTPLVEVLSRPRPLPGDVFLVPAGSDETETLLQSSSVKALRLFAFRRKFRDPS